MKRIYNKYSALLLVVLLHIFVLTGCGDDVNDPTPVNTAQSGISAVVNGANWASSDENYRLGTRVVTKGASAFVGAGDTLTVVGVQVQGTDTTAIVISAKLDPEKVGSYPIRSGTAGKANAYYLTKLSGNVLQEAKEKYDAGITNGELRITKYDPANYSLSGSFGFSMSATGETTYTVVAGKIENVIF